MLTAVPALPLAVHTAPAPSAGTVRIAPAKLPIPLPQPPGTPASNSSQALALPTGSSSNSYGEDVKRVSFEGLLHDALDQVEEPVPVLAPRITKAPAPDPKAIGQARAIGNVLPIAVHPDKTEPLPAVLSFALPVSTPVAAPIPVAPPILITSSVPASPYKDQTEGDRSAAPTPSVELQQPGPAGSEAFTVRLNSHVDSPAPPTPETPRKDAPVAEQPKLTASPAATEKATFEAPITTTVAAAPASDLKPVPTHSPAPVASIESTESPAPVTTPATPVRDLALHLPGAHGVEVRMTEESGEVHVEVRTGDQQFTQDLRDNLHELVSGLERKGLSAQISYGSANPAEHLFTRAGETSSSNDSPSDGQGGAFARDQEHKQQQQRQPEQKFDGRAPKARAAEWSETFKSNLEASRASRQNTTRDQ